MAYRAAYRALRVYWRIAHPRTHGALVLVWHRGKVLLVRNSYVRYYSAPGGYVRRRESGRAAAARELREETGIRVDPSALALALDGWHDWEGKHEHVEIYELDLPNRPVVDVDNREVVRAEFFGRDEALALDLFPLVRQLVARGVVSR